MKTSTEQPSLAPSEAKTVALEPTQQSAFQIEEISTLKEAAEKGSAKAQGPLNQDIKQADDSVDLPPLSLDRKDNQPPLTEQDITFRRFSADAKRCTIILPISLSTSSQATRLMGLMRLNKSMDEGFEQLCLNTYCQKARTSPLMFFSGEPMSSDDIKALLNSQDQIKKFKIDYAQNPRQKALDIDSILYFLISKNDPSVSFFNKQLSTAGTEQLLKHFHQSLGAGDVMTVIKKLIDFLHPVQHKSMTIQDIILNCEFTNNLLDFAILTKKFVIKQLDEKTGDSVENPVFNSPDEMVLINYEQSKIDGDLLIISSH